LFKSFLSNLLHTLYPNQCPYCEIGIKYNMLFCSDCEKNLNYDGYVKEFKTRLNQNFACLSVFKYEGNVKNAVLRYKFAKRRDYGEKFSKLMANCLNKKINTANFDIITSVPMDKIKIKKRGYNQSQELAEKLSKFINVKYKQTIRKIKKNSEQHTLSGKDRRKNCRGIYEIIDPSFIKNKKILICDDVVTTGSTLSECIISLKRAQITEVFCVTLAISTIDFK
jgi:ComF family protein